jgi:tryptophan-rich sensory protein
LCFSPPQPRKLRSIGVALSFGIVHVLTAKSDVSWGSPKFTLGLWFDRHLNRSQWSPADFIFRVCQSALIMSMKCAVMQMWIAKAEYDESGPSIVHRKCF